MSARDPRIEAIENFLEERLDLPFTYTPGLLAAADAADREAGIIRVDTNDQALIQRLRNAAVRGANSRPYASWEERVVSAVLAALREAGAV